jgi:hypothetical protein
MKDPLPRLSRRERLILVVALAWLFLRRSLGWTVALGVDNSGAGRPGPISFMGQRLAFSVH